MELTTLAIGTIAALCCGLVCAAGYWLFVYRRVRPALPPQEGIALRDSAAFALSSYWSRYYDGWSLALFRDATGVVRHVACETPDGRYFDASGYFGKAEIAQRIGKDLIGESGDEADVQALLDTNAAVLEAAEDLRKRVETTAGR